MPSCANIEVLALGSGGAGVSVGGVVPSIPMMKLTEAMPNGGTGCCSQFRLISAGAPEYGVPTRPKLPAAGNSPDIGLMTRSPKGCVIKLSANASLVNAITVWLFVSNVKLGAVGNRSFGVNCRSTTSVTDVGFVTKKPARAHVSVSCSTKNCACICPSRATPPEKFLTSPERKVRNAPGHPSSRSVVPCPLYLT